MIFSLPHIWAGLLAFIILAYVILDGFDLGIGIIFPFFNKGTQRDTAMNTIAPVWDGNETWLVLGGGGLFAAFPLAYAVVMPALYAPLIAMLLGLIFRGVAFEFRWRDKSHEKYWDFSFWAGSTMAAFSQGIVLGAYVQGIKVDGRAYGGGWMDWLTPFSLFTGTAVVLGYAFLGSCYLILKTEGGVRETAYRLGKPLFYILLVLIGLVSLFTPMLSPEIAQRWLTTPTLFWLAPIPLILLSCAVLLWRHLNAKRDRKIFPLALVIFTLCFIGLGAGTFPYIVPRAITVTQAAAPDSSLEFMLVGAVVLIPMILAYTAYSYWVFRGKVKDGEGYH
ncbi:cytochrome d ubiquinol oxidase subunit II [Hellea sp.]|nr:cytochrome d ubiquinol oxidase subunit II [Hellea sp.]